MLGQNLKKIFFQPNNYYLESADKIKNFFLEIKFYFFPTFRKITVGGFVNQLIKKILALLVKLELLQQNSCSTQQSATLFEWMLELPTSQQFFSQCPNISWVESVLYLL